MDTDWFECVFCIRQKQSREETKTEVGGMTRRGGTGEGRGQKLSAPVFVQQELE